MSDKFTEVGIAIAHGIYQGNETTFVVQMFGNPSKTSAVIVSSTKQESATAGVAGASAEAAPIGAIRNSRPSTIWRILTAPRTTLQYAYMGLAALILFAIGLLFLVELRRLHVPSLIRGAGLLALIVFMLYSGAALSGELLIL